MSNNTNNDERKIALIKTFAIVVSVIIFMFSLIYNFKRMDKLSSGKSFQSVENEKVFKEEFLKTKEVITKDYDDLKSVFGEAKGLIEASLTKEESLEKEEGNLELEKSDNNNLKN